MMLQKNNLMDKNFRDGDLIEPLSNWHVSKLFFLLLSFFTMC